MLFVTMFITAIIQLQHPEVAFAQQQKASASTGEQQAVFDCIKVPTREDMDRELRQLYSLRATDNNKDDYFDLDGFIILNKKDQISDLNYLTSNNRELPNTVDKTVTEAELLAKKKNRNQNNDDTAAGRTYNLSKYQTLLPTCHDIVCASILIFGHEGLEILWAYKTFNLNLSRYQNSEAIDFTHSEIDAAVRAFLALPSELYPTISMRPVGIGFYKVNKNILYKGHEANLEAANFAGRVTSDFSNFVDPEKMYAFVHELGHRSVYVDKKWRSNDQEVETPWDRTIAWLSLTHWVTQFPPGFSWRTAVWEKPTGTTSLLSLFNFQEDFAETFAAYRYTPQKLRQISPERYEYFKTNIFKGIEYTTDICRGTRNGVPIANNLDR